MEYIKETGISFNSGEQLTAKKLQILNDKINELVRNVNNILRGMCDLNVEFSNFDRTFSIDEALRAVSQTRRSRGMKIRFLDKDGYYVEYQYFGETVDDSNWYDVENNWAAYQGIIDGGEF